MKFPVKSALMLCALAFAGCSSSDEEKPAKNQSSDPGNASAPEKRPAPVDETPVANAAPAFTLPDPAGASHSLADYKGKWIVLEWVNHGCPFVKKHYGSKNMQGLQSKYTAKGVVWLSICSSAPGKQGNQEPAAWTDTLKSMGASPTAMLLDPDGKVGKLYDAKTTPHIFVIDPKGAIVYRGAIDDNPSANASDIPKSKNYVIEVLDAVLDGKPAPLSESKPYGCSVKY